MAGVTAQGATFSFNAVRATVVGIQVEEPQAEIVDMTGIFDPANVSVLVPTGAKSGGTITVDCLLPSSAPTQDVGLAGVVAFTSTNFSVARQGILESASVSARVGDLVRATLKFRLTDYTGT